MADPLDILSPTEAARAALGVAESGAHGAALELLVSAISRRIDEICGPVVVREVTEIHEGGGRYLWPRQAPVHAVTAVTEFDGTTPTVLADESEFGTAGTASGFAVVDEGHRIERRSGGAVGRFLHGVAGVQLVYEAGRYADTDSVDPKFKVAVEAILRRVWDREAGAWARGGDPFDENLQPTSRFFRAIDPMVDEWLGAERRPARVA